MMSCLPWIFCGDVPGLVGASIGVGEGSASASYSPL